MSLLDMNRMGSEDSAIDSAMGGAMGSFAMEASFDDLDEAFDDALFEVLDEGEDEPAAPASMLVTKAAVETAMEAVSKAVTEDSLEGRIEAFLTTQKGESITNWALAKEFGLTTRRCVKALKRLMRRNRVRVVMVAGRRQYYVPTAEQWQKLNELREAKMRSTGEYKLPQPMLDIWTRIRAERAGVPSYYGGAV